MPSTVPTSMLTEARTSSPGKLRRTSLAITGEVVVMPVTSAHPEIVGVLLNVNKDKTNVILGEQFITLFGDDFITDILGGVRLKITAPSFYQVNHGAAELLYAKAKELAAPQKTDVLLDLYCGAGSIGLSMADEAGEVIGQEYVPHYLTYGNFISAIINFLILAVVVFFIVRFVNRLNEAATRKEREAAEAAAAAAAAAAAEEAAKNPPAPPAPTQEELLAEIRDLLKNK